VIVSKGKESLKVPDLVGKSQKSAELTMDRFSLKKGDLIYVCSSEIAKDYVIAQNPYPDNLIAKGDVVDLLISKGTEEEFYVMPDLINLDMDVALNKLKSLHINLDRIISKYDEIYKEDIVINQSPEMGYPVSSEMGVTLTVNMKGEKKKDKEKFLIFSYVLPRGYKDRDLELVLINNLVNKRVLIKSKYPPGYYFKHLVDAPIGSVIELKMDGKVVKQVTVE
jgi:beta-lactam-binding protein with PASTA domain